MHQSLCQCPTYPGTSQAFVHVLIPEVGHLQNCHCPLRHLLPSWFSSHVLQTLKTNIIISLLNAMFFLKYYFSAIATTYDSSFKKDQDILVLPLDLLKFDTHEKLTQDVLKHFVKVWYSFLINEKSEFYTA